MRAKISKLGPVGDIIEEKKFNIPFIKKQEYGLCKLPDGTVVKTEPMRKCRYLLEINGYKYLLHPSGYIDRVGHEED
jgi:hypothetical protein